MIQKFRKKPVVIEAIQWDGKPETAEEIMRWCRYATYLSAVKVFHIHTLEGRMGAGVGDWIIRGIKGEFYPCKPNIFEATYEPVP